MLFNGVTFCDIVNPYNPTFLIHRTHEMAPEIDCCNMIHQSLYFSIHFGYKFWFLQK